MAGYSAVTAVKPKRRSAEAVTHVYVFLWKSSKVFNDEATYTNNKIAYKPGRTAYARMQKIFINYLSFKFAKLSKKEATLPDWPELIQRV